jgi:hypothetical protein
MSSEYLDNLTEAIGLMHGCRAVHFGSEKVTESFQGLDVWSGDVEVFTLEGHPSAQVAYGFAWKDETGQPRYIGILRLPPVQSATDAVKVAIASGQFR